VFSLAVLSGGVDSAVGFLCLSKWIRKGKAELNCHLGVVIVILLPENRYSLLYFQLRML